MIKAKIIIAIFLSCYISFSQITWTALQNIPSTTTSLSSETRNVVINNVVYVFNSETIYSYNIATDTWATVTAYPDDSRQGAYLIALGNKIYVMGGLPYDTGSSSARNVNWEYDLELDTWTQKANLPINPALITTYSLATFTYNNKIYVLDYILKGFYKYNQNIDTWSSLTNFPPTGLMTMIKPHFIMDTKFYTTFHRTSENENGPEEMWVYNFSTSNWTRLGDAPTIFRTGVFFKLGDLGYAGLGNHGGIFLDTFYRYDFSNDNWTQLNNAPFSAWNSLSFSVNYTGYVSQGFNNEKKFWKLEDSSNLSTSELTRESFSIFPNPIEANSILKIVTKLDVENKKYSLYTILGEVVQTGYVTNSSITIIPEKGFYLLVIHGFKPTSLLVQ